MINSIINVDLHIHSHASEYKDGELVKNGTIENLPVLFDKLNENNVALFAITDHNRFDASMFNKCSEIIETHTYENVKGNIAGVEFDVCLEERKNTCHIVTLFNVQNKEQAKSIQDKIEQCQLNGPEDFYTRKKYEQLLSDIGLDTILIVHQRHDINCNNPRKPSRSLSESTSDSYHAIEIGYIGALEYQNFHVEGILKNNLQKLQTNVSLVTGSDCHEWDYYPYHDRDCEKKNWNFTKMKCLPTFKGLLLAISSPQTRINPVQKEKNPDNIDSFSLKDTSYDLDPGINVIIGENGSGKSTLFDMLLHSDKKELKSYEKQIYENSGFKCDHQSNRDRTLQVSQAAIIEKYNNGKLFPKELFGEITHIEFETSYAHYSSSLFSAINMKINSTEKIRELGTIAFRFDPAVNRETYYVRDNNNIQLGDNDKKIEDHTDQVRKILWELKSEIETGFFNDTDKNLLIQAYINVKQVYRNLLIQNYSYQLRKQIKEIIYNKFNAYQNRIDQVSSSQDKAIRAFSQRKTHFIQKILTCIQQNSNTINYPNAPQIMRSGIITQSKNGFEFIRTAEYYGKNMIQEFYHTMFTRDYQDIDRIKKITEKEKLRQAIRQCNETGNIKDQYDKNYNKFIENSEKSKEEIQQITAKTKQGQTLGELSLAYYEYYLTCDDKPKTLVFIDQPEDNISNNHINEKLIRYFDGMRNNQQLFIVTHNPLLVVNLDADNVIITEMRNNVLTCKSGCLEDNGILEYIAENMDGGKESLKKRFKLYD